MRSMICMTNTAFICSVMRFACRGALFIIICCAAKERGCAWYDKRREELRQKIQTIYEDGRQIYGAGKIAAILKERGCRVSEQMVRELMQDMGLCSIRQGAKKQYDKETKRC